MKPIGAIALTSVLILTGCSTTSTAPPPAPDEASDNCLTVSPQATAALEAGIIDGYALTAITAIQTDQSWWVSAHLTGDPDVTATWFTTQNPTTGDAAYMSATKLASLTSTFLLPEDLTGSDAVTQSQACLP